MTTTTPDTPPPKSETPKVDAAAFDINQAGFAQYHKDGLYVSSELTGQLERENARLKERVAELEDYSTHHHDWLAACQIALGASEEEDNKSYWQHQIDTLNKLKP